jgi:hypothetical protein
MVRVDRAADGVAFYASEVLAATLRARSDRFRIFELVFDHTLVFVREQDGEHASRSGCVFRML